MIHESYKQMISTVFDNIEYLCHKNNISVQITFDRDELLFDLMNSEGRVVRLTKSKFIEAYTNGSLGI